MKLYLDDERPCPEGWIACRTVGEVIELLKTRQVTEMSLDNDLGIGYEEGYKVLDWLEEYYYSDTTFPLPKMRAHTSNSARRYYMNAIIRKLYSHQLTDKT